MIADSRRAISVAESIVHRHTISLDFYKDHLPANDLNIDRVDGHLYSRFPWAVSLFAVPVIVIFDGAHAMGIGPGVAPRLAAGQVDWTFQLLTMSYVVALSVVVMYEIARRTLMGDNLRRLRRLSLVVALVYALCTSAWSTASRSYWQHGPSMLLLSLAALLAVASRSDPRAVRWLGLPLAASYMMRPTNGIPCLFFTLWVALCHRRYLVQYVLGLAGVLSLFVSVNLSTWGTLLPPYYSGSRLGGNDDFLEALAANLVSPSRGLFIFSPVLLLAIAGFVVKIRRKSRDGLDLVLAACVSAHWISISTFQHWWGGNSFGPRLFSDMVPFLVILSLPALDALARPAERGSIVHAARGLSIAAAVVSLLIHFQGAYFRSSWCWNNEPTDVDKDQSKLWDWRDPQFLRGARRFVLGPNRRSEVIRGAVLKVGCPPQEAR